MCSWYAKFYLHLTWIQTILCIAISLNVLQIILRSILAYLSSRGGIAEVEKRKHVPTIVYMELFFRICEIIAYSFVLYLEAFHTACLSKVAISLHFKVYQFVYSLNDFPILGLCFYKSR